MTVLIGVSLVCIVMSIIGIAAFVDDEPIGAGFFTIGLIVGLMNLALNL